MSLEKLRHSKSPRSRGKPVYCLSWLADNYGCLIFSRLGAAPWGMATGSLAGHRAAREGAGHRARPPRSDLPASAPGRRRGNWRSVPISPPHPQQPECLVWASGIRAREGVGASGHVLEAPLPFLIKQPLTPSLGKWNPHFPSELSAQV